MHTGRLFAIAGVIIGVIGLYPRALRTDGADLLPQLHAANPSFPPSIPTVWGGLDLWAQIVLVILIVAVIGLAFNGVRSEAMDRNSSLTVAVIGAALLVYSVVKLFEARDEAAGLEAAFAQAAAGGAIPAAYGVATGIGFFILVVGTVLVIAGGFSGLRTAEKATES